MNEQAATPTPAKDGKARMTEQIRVRLTKAEKEKISLLAISANAEMSEYVRAAALNRKPKPSATATGDRRLALEMLAAFGRMRGNVKQIGDNLNSVARAGNRGRHVTDVDIIQALKEIESLGDIFRNLLNQSAP